MNIVTGELNTSISVQVEYPCVINIQALQKRLALQTYRVSSAWSAFLSEAWAATTESIWVASIWKVYLRRAAVRMWRRGSARPVAAHRTARRTRAHCSAIRVASGIRRTHRHAAATRAATKCVRCATGIAASQRERVARSATPRHKYTSKWFFRIFGHGGVRLACADRRRRNGNVRVWRECSAQSERRRLYRSSECVLRARVHSPRQRHTRRNLKFNWAVSAAARVTPTASRAHRDKLRRHPSDRWLPAPVRRELLLIFDWNGANEKHAIESFRATDNALTERRVLLDPQPFVFWTAWTLAGDQLVLSDWYSNLLVYNFVWTQYWRECATRRIKSPLMTSRTL